MRSDDGAMGGAGPSKARRAASAAGLVVASVVIGLLLAELGLRLFGDVAPPLRVRDPRIGERYIAGYDAETYSSESRRTVRLRFNELGFRGPDRPRAKSAGRRRVAVLGDSMVAALAVEEPETFVARTEAALRERAPSWQLDNFGVSASSPGQALVLYRALVRELDPDVVVLAFFVGNDLSDSSRALDTYPRPYFTLDDDAQLVLHRLSARRSRSSGWLNQNSRFYVWQKRVVNGALRSTKERAAILPSGWWIYAEPAPAPVQEAWRIVDAVLARFRDEVEADGRRFELLVLPSGRQIYADAFAPVADFLVEAPTVLRPDTPERRLQDICQERRLSCTFVVEAFAAAAGGRRAADTPADQLLFFNGTGHFTPRGHAVAAEVLTRVLSRTSTTP